MKKQIVYTPPLAAIRRFKALLAQSGTANPTMVILENSTGHIPTIVRTGTGIYNLVFPADIFGNLAVQLETFNNDPSKHLQIASISGAVTITYNQNIITSVTPTDGIAANTSITINIYNLKNANNV